MFIHELKAMVASYLSPESQGQGHVLATVVHLKGSSYRKPGVAMLIREDGHMTGAVSGGCVEKEVFRQSLDVFASGSPRLMTYDGRYRLGCEGILYILLEPFDPAQEWIEAFHLALSQRWAISFTSYFDLDNFAAAEAGTVFHMGKSSCSLRKDEPVNKGMSHHLEERMNPAFKLIIVGGEHDAVELCRLASGVGWEVDVITSPGEQKPASVFVGATSVEGLEPAQFDVARIDGQTAVVLMSHNYATDFQFLLSMTGSGPAYVGLLGPSKRREKLFAELIEHEPLIDTDFLDLIHGPAGLDIGSVTPQEIAISIISEILAFTRSTHALSLSAKEKDRSAR
jgi:xanthine/CO dehydrogenase XdhC/CoxF family maturation factor